MVIVKLKSEESRRKILKNKKTERKRNMDRGGSDF